MLAVRLSSAFSNIPQQVHLPSPVLCWKQTNKQCTEKKLNYVWSGSSRLTCKTHPNQKIVCFNVVMHSLANVKWWGRKTISLVCKLNWKYVLLANTQSPLLLSTKYSTLVKTNPEWCSHTRVHIHSLCCIHNQWDSPDFDKGLLMVSMHIMFSDKALWQHTV